MFGIAFIKVMLVTLEIILKTPLRWWRTREYDFVDKFSEGLARAGQGNQRFHVRPNGDPAYLLRFHFVGRFHGGLASAKFEDQQEGVVNEAFHIFPDGNRAYDGFFRDVGDFRDGVAWALGGDDEELWIYPNGRDVLSSF